MSVPISARATLLTPPWWWCSAASVISGAPWSAPSPSASPPSASSRWRARCWARSLFWSLSSCSSRNARAGCSRSRGGRWKYDSARAHAFAGSRRDLVYDRGRRGRRTDPAVEPAVAGRLLFPGADLSGGAVGQICLLRRAGARDRSDLGLLRHSLARARRVLRARRLRDGHVSDAPDRQPRRLWQPDPARLHGVPELPEAALVLERF